MVSGVYSDVTLNLENRCKDFIWRGSSPSIWEPEPYYLTPGDHSTLTVSDPWSGTIWPRSHCRINASYYFSCATGDCRTGQLACSIPKYPVTELIFKINDSVVSYDISLVHGQNVLVCVKPNGGTLVDGGSGPCPMVECNKELSSVCPSHLIAYGQEGQYVGCKNSCDVIDDPRYCCDGVTCIPDEYMKMNKQLCPDATTFQGDKPPYQCKGASSYDITLCPDPL
ncbi:thaumatin-like protein 1 [Lotus japonicus]|uniref:thaumatin-like protein 1 n=1 Tax=Lotus japonicus TaxID=34305 RepID=UPI00258A9AEF|nr:thaumatin-like protein 1 [Lotus japonicus]